MPAAFLSHRRKHVIIPAVKPNFAQIFDGNTYCMHTALPLVNTMRKNILLINACFFATHMYKSNAITQLFVRQVSYCIIYGSCW